MELLDAYNNPIPATAEAPIEAPAVIIPRPFVLSEQPKDQLKKLTDEIMDKQKMWENNFSAFFGEYLEMANAWRMIPQSAVKRPAGFSNTRAGETHRAVNTKASLKFAMLTAADPFIEARAFGLDEMGNEVSAEECFAIVEVLMRQSQVLQFKKKLFRGLKSLELFGSLIVECPFVSIPYGSGQPYFEGTDFIPRSLLQVGFDPYVYDIELSDYIFTIDYVTKYKLRELASTAEEVWDRNFVEAAVNEQETDAASSSSLKTNVWSRIEERKNRAGYTTSKLDILELLNYHGKLDTSNPVLENFWASQGRTDDIKAVDWTVGVVNADNVVRLHVTPYGNWRHLLKVYNENEFELEPMGYGVGKLGREQQRRIDTTQNRMNDLLKQALFGMWKLGKYAGFKANDFAIKPLNIIQLEDINQFEPIRPDMQAIVNALAMQTDLREDFRQTVEAQSNLQAELTKASATEAAIAQKEGMRGASVSAQVTAEKLRDFFETCHINNTDLLDYEIAVAMTGQLSGQTRRYNKNNLPRGIGIKIKTTTDKDFRPERIANLLRIIEIGTSVRQLMPSEVNLVPVVEELAVAMGINPMRLWQERPVKNQMLDQLRRAQINNQPMMENASEVAASGAPSEQQVGTPVGDVPTSPGNPVFEAYG